MDAPRRRPPAPRLLAPLALAALVLAPLAVACDDGDLREGAPPRIAVTPAALSFQVVPLGSSSDELVQVRNTGEAELEVTRVFLQGRDAEMFAVNVDLDTPYAGELIALEPSAQTELQVIYTPERVGAAEAELCLESNDPLSPVTCVELVALEIAPSVQVTPSPIIFGQVPAGDAVAIDVTVTNVGSAPLVFATRDEDGDGVLEETGIAVTGSLDFTPDKGTREAVLFAEAATGLEPSESTTITLWYRPPTQSPDEGWVVVSYLVGDELRHHETPITANGNEPCVRVSPEEIDFGPSLIGNVNQKLVALENCGSSNLTVTGLALSADADDTFDLAMVPANLAGGTGEEVIPRGQSRQFFVTFTPTAEAPSTGTLVVESNDPARPVLEVPIFGSGSFNTCPVAVGEGQVVRDSKGREVDNPAPLAAQFVAEPLDTIRLSAAASNDPDGNAIVEYQWSLVEAPAGFSLGFFPRADVAEPQIQLALVGDYVFEVTVVDQNGCVSEPARVDVRARTDKALVVELTWRTPSDVDETDTCFGCGTDVDLHMLNGAENAFWGDKFGTGDAGGTDCYFANTDPHWGNLSDLDDDPALDRDDTDGGGPEQINIKRPAFTDGTQPDGYAAPYQVGVYFYDAAGFEPPVLATTRIYLDGSDVPAAVWPTVAAGEEAAVELVVSDKSLQRTGDFWLAGAIDWTAEGGQLTEINQLFQGFPK